MANPTHHRITLGGQEFAPGVHACRIPVTVDLDDSPIDLRTTVVVGDRPGPTLLVTSTLHGIEWLSIEVVKRLVEATDPRALRGTLIALPVANNPAFGRLSRSTPDHSDNADLNRAFPGGGTWITEQLASTITNELLPRADAVMDYHFGAWGHAMGSITYGSDFPNSDVVDQSRQMALAYGWPLVRSGPIATKFPGPRSLVGYAGTTLGIPSLIGGVGGAGFGRETEESWITTNVQGTLGAMKVLEMFDDPPPAPKRFLDFQLMHRVNPKTAGLFYPTHERDTLGREVEEGEVLGRVVSPYTFEEREVLRAPCDGYLMYIARWAPVRPGEWAFGVIDASHEKTRWTNLES
jgi:predicted deacylase